MLEIPVELGPRRYLISVGHGIARSLPDLLGPLRGRRTVVVASRRVWGRHGKALERPLRALGPLAVCQVPDGEQFKSRRTLDAVYDAFLKARLGRDGLVVAIGGGVVGDLGGFAAATWMRGVDWVGVPTTLLAMVDSSIGGKVGVNHAQAKNMIGAFHQPRLVIVDPAVARTLPEREFRSGLAEIVKHGIVLDADYFQDLESNVPSLLTRDLAILERIVVGSCQLKARVVEHDEHDAELRWVLNYGHTIGHALEAATGFRRWVHGEAVSLGVVAESRLAERLEICSPATANRQLRLLAAVGLPVTGLHVEPASVIDALSRDKKTRDGRTSFVLAPEIGSFRIVPDVPSDAILEILKELR